MFYLRREREERESGRSEDFTGGCGGDLGAGGARLGPDRDGRDGRHVPGGHRRSRRSRPGRSSWSRLRGRLADRPAGAARLAREPGQKGGIPIIKNCRGSLAIGSLGADPHARATPPAVLCGGLGGLADRAGDSRVRDPHGEPGHRLVAAEPERGQDLQQGPEGLPRWPNSRGRRGERGRRDLASGQRRDRRPSQAGSGKPVVQAAGHDGR